MSYKFKPRQIAGRGMSPDAARCTLNLSRWSVNAARRLSQFRRPGVYSFVLVVKSTGERILDIGNGPEELGQDV